MATKPKDANLENSAEEAVEAPAASLVDQIGTLTYPRAVQHFGKDKALDAMKEVARIGGHGEFDDAHLMSPMFGGLQMPDPSKIQEPKREDFAKLAEADFYYGQAVEKWEETKQQAVENRGRINEYYNSLK